jgi:hypothetical protein
MVMVWQLRTRSTVSGQALKPCVMLVSGKQRTFTKLCHVWGTLQDYWCNRRHNE